MRVGMLMGATGLPAVREKTPLTGSKECWLYLTARNPHIGHLGFFLDIGTVWDLTVEFENFYKKLLVCLLFSKAHRISRSPG